MCVAPCKGIRNPGNFGLWNPEATALESRIQLMESGIQNRILKFGIQPLKESGIHRYGIRNHRHGIRNPQTWNPESTDMESGLHSVESGIQDSLKLPYMGPCLNQFKELQRPPVKFSVKVQISCQVL